MNPNPPAVSELIDRFADVRARHPALADVLRGSLQRLGWSAEQLKAWEGLTPAQLSQQGGQALIYRVGLRVAELAEGDLSAAYHNRDHTAEAVFSAEALLAAEPLSASQKQRHSLRLLVAMMAHDLGHTGAFGSPKGSLETASAEAFERVWDEFAPHPPTLQSNSERGAIRSLVLGTEFTEGPRRNAEAQAQDPSSIVSRLHVLANDADILASVLPQTGPERGRLLAQEWTEAGPHAAGPAAVVGTWAGRLGFLKAIRLNSRGAEAMGATALREQEIAAIEQLTPSDLSAKRPEEAQQAVVRLIAASPDPSASVRSAPTRPAPR